MLEAAAPFCVMSASLSYVFLGIGLLLAALGWLWSVIVGFQRSPAWGFTLLFFPLAGLVFVFVAWEDGKRPVFTHLAGVLVCGLVLAFAFRDKLGPFSKQVADKPTKIHSPAPAAKQPVIPQEPGQRLNELKQKERDLLARKARLEPGDAAGAQALAEEISRYNAELKTALGERISTAP